MKKKVIIAVFIVIILVLFIISAIILFYPKSKDKEEIRRSWRTKYFINIDSNITSNYTLILPIALTMDGNISEIMNEIELVNGSGSFEMVNSKYGVGLQVNGIGNLTIGIEKKFERKNNNDAFKTERKYSIDNVSLWARDYGGIYSEEGYSKLAYVWSYSPEWNETSWEWNRLIDITIEMEHSWHVQREYPSGDEISYKCQMTLGVNIWDFLEFYIDYFEAI